MTAKKREKCYNYVMVWERERKKTLKMHSPYHNCLGTLREMQMTSAVRPYKEKPDTVAITTLKI